MRAMATVRLKFPSKKQLETVSDALNPEVDRPSTVRAKANLEKHEAFLVLKVECRDTVALRATLNTYLRWISAVCAVFSILDSLEPFREL